MKDFLNLTPADTEMLIQGLEALKTKDFAGEVFGLLLDGLVKPGPRATIEEIYKYEQRKKEEEAQKILKEKKAKEYAKEIDLLKAKITLIRSFRESEQVSKDIKNPSRQLNA